jgi:transcriptional regulator with XRE-family HTH domain
MESISPEQCEFAVEFLKSIKESRGYSQVEMEQLSSVDQSTISKILNGQMQPTTDTLIKLFDGLGVKLEHVLREAASTSNEIVGYLATPLTGVATGRTDLQLRRAVERIKTIASEQHFSTAPSRFQLYWPGDHTHPVTHPHLTPARVYLIDRSRASTFDFVILLCAEPSYGVGQENEIATQAGLPAIRIVPQKTSRMITGSFLLAKDVAFEGTLQDGLKIDEPALGEAFRDIRRVYIRHRVLHGPKGGRNFGERLRSLLDDRSGDDAGFAEELGVSLSYLQALLNEPLAVSNPSACLLLRMAKLLNVTAGYLLRETAASDPVYIESLAHWRTWVKDTLGDEIHLALAIRDEWCEQHQEKSRALSTASHREDKPVVMKVNDWDRLYKSRLSESQGTRSPSKEGHGESKGLFPSRQIRAR